MTDRPIVLFVFAGRRKNMELQLMWARRVLQLHPNVSYHIWCLARDPADKEWLQTITGERIVIRNEYAHLHPGWGMHQVWAHYSTRAHYRDTLLVKVDDDVVFLDPNRFGAWLELAEQNPGIILSADVVNNGACNNTHPELAVPGCGSLAVHASPLCAKLAHEWFITNWREACTAPVVYTPTPGWCSINAIALDWRTAGRILALLNMPGRPPAVIGGHRHGRKRVGDEGAANMLPHAIASGIMAAHLMFGPQQLPEEELDSYRAGYAQVLDEICTPKI